MKGVMMQYFEWYLPTSIHLWKKIENDAAHLNQIGISALWMPPAFKGIGGVNEVGYGVYDIYDLGEFDQQGTIPTKYGTKDEYIKAIKSLHNHHIQVYGDIVLNHKMGADGTEMINAYEVNPYNKNEITSSQEKIEVPTLYTFPNRKNCYSDFKWDWTCFDGVDEDVLSKRHQVFLFQDKSWNDGVDEENGNFDYLMGADIDFSQQKVVDELKKWGLWYLDMTHIDGLRLDAVKHISASFYKDWLAYLRNQTGKELFSVGEYWHGDINRLMNYLNQVDYTMSLFDVPLHYHFYDACHSNGQYDMRNIFKDTLVERAPMNAVTFVDNHDTQPSQGLQSWIDDWFKPLAYALIMLRKDGYPCVFYGDYYGIEHSHTPCFNEVIDDYLSITKKDTFDEQNDYFDDPSCIAWMRKNQNQEALVCIMSINGDKEKRIYVGKELSQQVLSDPLHHRDVEIDQEGYGVFSCEHQSVYVYRLMR